MSTPALHITREKHLNHLVRVVPLIALFHGVQSYIFIQIDGPFGTEMLMTLSAILASMIAGLVFYDVNHKTTLFEEHLEIHFKALHKAVSFDEIISVTTTDPKENFGTVVILTKQHGKIRLHFVDDVDKIKKWIESRQSSLQAAA